MLCSDSPHLASYQTPWWTCHIFWNNKHRITDRNLKMTCYEACNYLQELLWVFESIGSCFHQSCYTANYVMIHANSLILVISGGCWFFREIEVLSGTKTWPGYLFKLITKISIYLFYFILIFYKTDDSYKSDMNIIYKIKKKKNLKCLGADSIYKSISHCRNIEQHKRCSNLSGFQNSTNHIIDFSFI